MTEQPLLTKRARRPQGRDVENVPPGDVICTLAETDAFHELLGRHVTREIGGVGRPPTNPGALLLTVAALGFALGSHRKAIAEVARPEVWNRLRQPFAERYPDYAGPRSPFCSVTRHQVLRWLGRYGTVETIDDVRSHFEGHAASVAKELGLLVDEGSLSKPDMRCAITGDGTTLKAKYKSLPGTMQVDRETGEITERRFDPNARFVQSGDGKHTIGQPYVILSGATTHPLEQVIYSIQYVPNDRDEASIGVDLVLRLKKELLPALSLVTWDKAMRGTHIDKFLKAGLQVAIKKSLNKSGAHDTRAVEQKEICFDDDRPPRSEMIYTRAGQAGLLATVQGEKRFMSLGEPQIKKQKNRGDGSYRWYGKYTVPSIAGIPRALHGGDLWLRLDTSSEDEAREYNRAENLRAFSTDHSDWERLYGLRNNSESVNSRMKAHLADGRAQSVDPARNTLYLLLFGAFVNQRALIARDQRLRREREQRLAA